VPAGPGPAAGNGPAAAPTAGPVRPGNGSATGSRAAGAAGPARAGRNEPPGPANGATPGPDSQAASQSAPEQAVIPAGPRRSARRRLATERLFAELASLAGIPVDAYAIGEEVEGALCLIQTEHGFEVFHSAEGNRHELQSFGSEEAACFYLFGVLAADGVRKGTLLPAAGRRPNARPSR
jgi:hypothetical protein